MGDACFYRNTGTNSNYNFEFENEDFFSEHSFSFITFYDMDNDNDLDAFNSSCYFENTGDSVNFNFSLITDNFFNFDLQDTGGLKMLSTFDEDNDGDNDIFISFIRGQNSFYENTGTADSAQFELITKNYLTIDVGRFAFTRLVDIDNDEDYDLFISDRQNIWHYKNVGDKYSPVFEFRSGNYQSLSDTVDYLSLFAQFDFADIDADGDYDIFTGGMDVTEYYNSIYFFKNTGSPDSASFKLEDDNMVMAETEYNIEPSPLFVDIDNDEDLDLFVSQRSTYYDGTNAFHLFRNTGDKYNPVWYYEEDIYFHLPLSSYDIWDYDNDGDWDLFTGKDVYVGLHVHLVENTGTPDSAYFAYVGIFDEYIDSINVGINGNIEFCDIDSDEDMDIFLADGGGGIAFFRNDGPVSLIEEGNHRPEEFVLFQNYPNPFNPETVISYHLPFNIEVNLSVYNIMGQKVKTLVNKKMQAGRHQVTWNGKKDNGQNVSSGVYFYRLSINNKSGIKSFTEKMVLLR